MYFYAFVRNIHKPLVVLDSFLWTITTLLLAVVSAFYQGMALRTKAGDDALTTPVPVVLLCSDKRKETFVCFQRRMFSRQIEICCPVIDISSRCVCPQWEVKGLGKFAARIICVVDFVSWFFRSRLSL